ncbi:MAG TPA: 5-bromo-4-chloroindolyl phosphate hydrolysis family protein [Candidatus Mediterraneibacter cottocaccae]|nr:5-bromo-4-chloroindolyl phosphate hydrolysis family protein [Candidatus Mediterraneibacter cottocaccae]
MKDSKWKENLSIAVSALLALLVFLVLLLNLGWNLFLCMALAAAVYIALGLILKPTRKIGKLEIDSMANGELLNERLTEAWADYERMRRATLKITEPDLQASCRELLGTARNIFKYLTDNPEKIPAARRYIDYYQETAANVLEHYVELKNTGLSTKETEKVLKNIRESVATLKAAFDMQFEKLMQNELFDMEADLNLLKQTLMSEGCPLPRESAGSAETAHTGQGTPAHSVQDKAEHTAQEKAAHTAHREATHI